MPGYEPLIIEGLKNFEVVYFLGAELFEILGGYHLGGPVTPRGVLLLSGP